MELAVKVIFLLTYTAVLKECWSYRILGIFPSPGSHMITFKRLMKSLADRGHQVDVASRFPLEKPHANYTDIHLKTLSRNSMNDAENILTYKNSTSDSGVTATYNDILLIERNLFNVHFMTTELGNRLCEEGLMDPYLQNIIKNPPTKQPYDLVIVEIFTAHCFMAFGHHLKVPVVGVSSNALYPWSRGIISNPENPAIVSNNLLGLSQPINFWNRLYNTLHNFFFKHYYRYYSSIQTDIIRNHFGPNTPDIRELENNVALILANSEPVLHGMVPKTPAFVEVGGLHIYDDGTKISADHKKWMDESDAGFVYFTFGSMTEIESFPPQALAAFYESFGKLSPVRVLMKIFDPKKLPPGLPENIRTFTRLPQLQVLKHKNIRAFITHGGLKGLQEAIYCAVPIIGIPLFSDQFLNVALSVKNNMAIQLNLRDISQNSLDIALNEILHNPIYREAAKKMSDKFLDRPMSAIDTACYWVEYVGRHGSQALRSPALDLAWWQVALLDVYLTIFFVALLFSIFLVMIIYFSIRFCKRPFQKSKMF